MCFRNGGMLTGAEIEKQIKKGHIGITPYDPVALNPNSYNLKLHPQLLVYARGSDRYSVIHPDSTVKDHDFCQDLLNVVEILQNRLAALENRSSFNSIDSSTSDNKNNHRIMKSIKGNSKPEKFKKFDTLLLKTTGVEKEDKEDAEQLTFFHEESNSANNEEEATSTVKTAYEYMNDKGRLVNIEANELSNSHTSITVKTISDFVKEIDDRVDNVLADIDSIKDSYNENVNELVSKIENEFNLIDEAFANIDKKIISTDTARKQADTKLKNEISASIENLSKKLEYYISSLRDYIQNNFVKKDFLAPLDMMKENKTIELTIPEEGLVLQPGVLYIGRTVERTWTDKYIPMINGRSSGGRLGISVHVCAGFGDIGFDGTWTLEITVVEPVRIYANTDIAQVCYFKPCGKVGKLYRGRYYKQEEATASRFYKPKEDI